MKLSGLTKAVAKEAKVTPGSTPPPAPLVSDDLIAIAQSPPQFSIIECNIVAYLAGYLVKKALRKFPACSTCKDNLVSNNSELEISTLFLNAKLYDPSCSLVRPTSTVVEFVSCLEATFRAMTPRFHKSGLLRTF